MATSKTMPSVSTGNKPNTNKVNFTYLVLVTEKDCKDLDCEEYWVFDGKMTFKEILLEIGETWNNMDVERLRFIKVRNTDVKRVKQTLELV